MRYQEFSPRLELRPFIQLVWCLEVDGEEAFASVERIAPDGIVEIVFHYREPLVLRFADASFARQPRSSLVCQTRRFIEIQPSGPTGFISVRFRPWGAYHFLGDPITVFADQVVPAEDIWGASVRELEDHLAMAAGVRERVALVEQFLMRQIVRYRKVDVELPVRAIWAKTDRIDYTQLYRELGITERSAQRIFARVVGMAPRSYGRLVRFLQTCAFLRRSEWVTLSEAAHQCGYFDQSHFISDFHTFAGMTPGDFAKRRQLSFFELD